MFEQNSTATFFSFNVIMFIAQVLRAQNLMAAESRVSGQIRPSGPYPPAGISPEEMAVPQGLRHSLPLNENKMSARQKIQAKIDSERFFVPKKQDTTRFQPGQFAKVCVCLYTTYFS